MQRVTSSHLPSSKSRQLNWADCYNTRDLGRLPTLDGYETKSHAIIRSDMLGRLTEQGKQALLAYGVRTIIDLRSPKEAQLEPSLSPQDTNQQTTYFNLPLESKNPKLRPLIHEAESRSVVYCLILDYSQNEVATILRTILSTEKSAGILIHCHAGKDRTGIIAAILLDIARVSREIIAQDYAQSQQCLWPLYEKLVKEAGGEDNIGPWMKPTATPAVIIQMFDHLDHQYGGVSSYLQTCGLTTNEIHQLKERLAPD